MFSAWFGFHSLFMLVCWFHCSMFSAYWFLVPGLGLAGTLFSWWRDVLRESLYMEVYSMSTIRMFRMGMVLFIASEAMFFFAFFWAFFHSSLAPTVQIGCVWPPVGIEPISASSVPLLNTAVLLGSGSFVTWSHQLWKQGCSIKLVRGRSSSVNDYSLSGSNVVSSVELMGDIVQGDFYFWRGQEALKKSLYPMIMTCLLGVYFTWLQYSEYCVASFTMADGVYGSTFYLTTGFHGLHVIIGTIFLLVCLWRMKTGRFFVDSHCGLEAGIWYWHFVDVIWIIVYLSIYVWGGWY